MSMSNAEKLQQMFEADFFRCVKCSSIFTLLDQANFMAANTKGPCPTCGGNRYTESNPENLKWWEWGLPRVWWFCFLRFLKRV